MRQEQGRFSLRADLERIIDDTITASPGADHAMSLLWDRVSSSETQLLPCDDRVASAQPERGARFRKKRADCPRSRRIQRAAQFLEPGCASWYIFVYIHPSHASRQSDRRNRENLQGVLSRPNRFTSFS
jgi:hypothetical protein